MACSQESSDLTFTSSTNDVVIRTKVGVARDLNITAAGSLQQVLFDYDVSDGGNSMLFATLVADVLELDSNRKSRFKKDLKITNGQTVQANSNLLLKGDETETKVNAEQEMELTGQRVKFEIPETGGQLTALNVSSSEVVIKGDGCRFQEKLDLSSGRLVLQTLVAVPSTGDGLPGQLSLVKSGANRYLYVKTGPTTWKSVTLTL